jgi:hypothetical protein
MEPTLATGGNRWHMALSRTRLRQAKTVAQGCMRLLSRLHGKEGSTVRVRQRAFRFPCRSAVSVYRAATSQGFDVHQTSTAPPDCLLRDLETLTGCGFTVVRGGVHPASTIRSSASSDRGRSVTPMPPSPPRSVGSMRQRRPGDEDGPGGRARGRRRRSLAFGSVGRRHYPRPPDMFTLPKAARVYGILAGASRTRAATPSCSRSS